MDSKSPDRGKLRLRNTDTNRFKVDTGRLKPQPPPTQAPAQPEEKIEIKAPTAAQTQAAEYVDPISLRDTSTSKLKKLDGVQSVTAAPAPEKKSETVRLKVVRATPRPGTMPPVAQAPLANVLLSATESEEEKPAVGIRPGATTNLSAVYPEQKYVGDTDSESSPGLPTETGTLQVSKAAPKEGPPPAVAPITMPGMEDKPAEAEKPLSSATIKLAVKKPPTPAAPEKAEAPAIDKPAAPETPAAPAAVEPPPAAPPPEQTVAVKPPAPTPAPTPAAEQTVAVKPPESAGATVKVTPEPTALPKSGIKLGIKKTEPAKPETPEPTTAADATVAVTPAPKGLRLSKSAAQTVAVSLPGLPPEPGKEAPAQSAAQMPFSDAAPQSEPATAGIGALEGITALVATLALAVTIFSLVMSLLKQL